MRLNRNIFDVPGMALVVLVGIRVVRGVDGWARQSWGRQSGDRSELAVWLLLIGFAFFFALSCSLGIFLWLCKKRLGRFPFSLTMFFLFPDVLIAAALMDISSFLGSPSMQPYFGIQQVSSLTEFLWWTGAAVFVLGGSRFISLWAYKSGWRVAHSNPPLA
jgi:hypothetical protein